ncbi:MAG: glucose-1-phosphate cytidylyltransferase [Acidimicrobiia bacterium]|nr:glucose-1-phosphate cytidylyltransferase [Acidimicrobiia bacterium]
MSTTPTPTDNRDIPVVLLCGGFGTRIREASESLPKPMIDIGGRPIVWHIMKTYSEFGFRRFVLCLGYKADDIKDYFLRYREHQSDFTVKLGSRDEPTFHVTPGADGIGGDEDWEVTCVDTGLETFTGGRLARVAPFLDVDTFMLTYGDGVADVDIAALLAAHRDHGLIGTVTAVHPTSRFGELQVDGGTVTTFAEKPMLNEGLVNGGYFVFERAFLDYVSLDAEMLESGALQKLTADGQLGHFVHKGFWRGMDTYREYVELNGLWDEGVAPWKIW